MFNLLLYIKYFFKLTTKIYNNNNKSKKIELGDLKFLDIFCVDFGLLLLLSFTFAFFSFLFSFSNNFFFNTNYYTLKLFCVSFRFFFFSSLLFSSPPFFSTYIFVLCSNIYIITHRYK